MQQEQSSIQRCRKRETTVVAAASRINGDCGGACRQSDPVATSAVRHYHPLPPPVSQPPSPSVPTIPPLPPPSLSPASVAPSPSHRLSVLKPPVRGITNRWPEPVRFSSTRPPSTVRPRPARDPWFEPTCHPSEPLLTVRSASFRLARFEPVTTRSTVNGQQ